MVRAHIDEEAALSQCARSIAGGRSQLLRHGVIRPPAEATGYRLAALHSRAGQTQHIWHCQGCQNSVKAARSAKDFPRQILRRRGYRLAANIGQESDRLGLSVAKAEEVQVVSWVVSGALGLQRLPNEPIHHADGVRLEAQNLLHRVGLGIPWAQSSHSDHGNALRSRESSCLVTS